MLVERPALEDERSDLVAVGFKQTGDEPLERTGARAPDECHARIGVIENEARQQWESVGFENGLMQARRECVRRYGGRVRSVHEGHPDD
jgi:hypothetical protein